MESFVEHSKALRGIVYLVDSKLGPQPVDFETIEGVRSLGCPVMPVMSKCDKANQSETAKTRNAIASIFGENVRPIRLSVLRKIGLFDLWQEILSAVASEGK